MSLGPSVTLSSVELVNLYLLALLDCSDCGCDLCTLDIWSTELSLVAVDNSKNLFCLVRGALLKMKEVDEDALALFRLVLLS